MRTALAGRGVARLRYSKPRPNVESFAELRRSLAGLSVYQSCASTGMSSIQSGERARAVGGGLGSMSRLFKIERATVGSRMVAMKVSRPPQEQASASMS